MKRLTIALLAISASFVAQADHPVSGYVKSDGTYVAPHYQSDPNALRYDNYSSHGNYNPYNGATGHERNEFSTPPAYNQPKPYESPYGYQPH